ncbi:MAG: UDP-galactopyranose mutase [Gaiellaceae bacterium]
MPDIRRAGQRVTDFDLVCVSHLRWDFVWQRPQQLLTRCAHERRVFFVEEPVFAEEGAPRLRVRHVNDRLIVAVPELPSGCTPAEADDTQERLLRRLLLDFRIEPFVLWLYTPMAVAFTRTLAPLAVVYDCMDELSAFAHAPDQLAPLEAELFRRADLVLTGGRSLFEAKRGRHPHVHLFPSSVDSAHFAVARLPGPEPHDQAEISRPRLGYAGVIDERLDLELIASVADARPSWQLVLVGPVAKIDPACLPQRPNLHYLGAKDYADLPGYLRAWDVALLPFARNRATRFISPTKTPEYLVAGLPVVSTPIADVVRPYGEEGFVHIAEGPAGFVAAAEEAMQEDPVERLRRVDAFLTENSWDFMWADISELVEGAVRRRAASRLKKQRRADGPAKIERFDFLVVGAGFAGSVLAERLARQLGLRVLVVDRRSHIGGNAHDHYDEAGILVHRYGPHIFHTNSREVFDYLSRFTLWRPYEHRVLASVDGRLVPFPINLDTVNEIYGLDLSVEALEPFLDSVAERRKPIRTSEDFVLSKVGHDLYLKFFRDYTRKMWDLDPSELDASVAARVPARLSRDDRYFTDAFQAMPLHGYSRMFEQMLHHPQIKVLLNTDFREIAGLLPHDRTIYTGPIDEFFDFRFGKLPYRSLEFRFETLDQERALPAAVVNHPNEHSYTRVTEFKYLTGQIHPSTTVVYEYPRPEGDPYYPVPRPENAELYKRYKELADAIPDVFFVGRLATYKYYNMDQVVAQALAMFRRIAGGGTELESELTRDLALARHRSEQQTTRSRP